MDCTECGNQVSDMAQACPKCGAPISRSFVTDVDDLAKDTVSTGEKGSGRQKTAAATIYILQLATIFFNIIPFIVALIFTRYQRKKAVGTWLESHFDYHRRTNKIALYILGIACLLIVVLMIAENDPYGFYLLGLTPYLMFPWLLYRGIRGGLALFNNEQVH